MSHGTNANLYRARLHQHQQEARDEARNISEAIKKSVQPLSEADAQRPFMIPRDHDPFDIWSCILDKVTDHHDILTLWNTCLMFREILTRGRRYVQATLPRIIQLIVQRRPQYLLQNEIRPEISTTLKMTLLSIRLISKLCSASSEGLLRTDDSNTFHLKLKSVGKIQIIIDNILGKEIMPDSFFPPCLEVSEHDVWNRNAERVKFFKAIAIILELVGKRIITFRYKCVGRPQRVYENLMKWVLYMPILENLELEMEHGGGYLRSAMPGFGDLQGFPVCPNLRSFTQNRETLPEAYVQRIVVANPEIKTLTQPIFALDEELMEPSVMNWRLEYLECLNTPLYSSLIGFLEFRIPLRKIVFLRNQRQAGLTHSKLFTFLNQFADSLEHLELQFHLGATEQGCFLNLPNLKYFKMLSDRRMKNLNFLLHEIRLEVIHMVVWEYITDAAQKALLYEFLHNATNGFDGSNVWEVFPKMRKIVMEFLGGAKTREICRP